MNSLTFTFAGETLHALGSGALYWPRLNCLCVSDLHLCKTERTARRKGLHLPPYETRDTLNRLSEAIDATNPSQVICLGDSFDDLAAAHALSEEDALDIARMQAGREWIWIEGNHDPGPVDLGGTHLAEWAHGPLIFRHIAEPDARGEISGHYHPKATLVTRARAISRPAFLVDDTRLILPAFGTYTGGLRSDDAVLSTLMAKDAKAILTGPHPVMIPMPRKGR